MFIYSNCNKFETRTVLLLNIIRYFLLCERELSVAGHKGDCKYSKFWNFLNFFPLQLDSFDTVTKFTFLD